MGPVISLKFYQLKLSEELVESYFNRGRENSFNKRGRLKKITSSTLFHLKKKAWLCAPLPLQLLNPKTEAVAVRLFSPNETQQKEADLHCNVWFPSEKTN